MALPNLSPTCTGCRLPTWPWCTKERGWNGRKQNKVLFVCWLVCLFIGLFVGWFVCWGMGYGVGKGESSFCSCIM